MLIKKTLPTHFEVLPPPCLLRYLSSKLRVERVGTKIGRKRSRRRGVVGTVANVSCSLYPLRQSSFSWAATPFLDHHLAVITKFTVPTSTGNPSADPTISDLNFKLQVQSSTVNVSTSPSVVVLTVPCD